MKKLTLTLFAVMLLFMVQASHYLGSDLTYKYLRTQNGEQIYEVTLTTYTECENGFIYGTPEETISSFSGSTMNFIKIPRIEGPTDVTPICDLQFSACSNTNPAATGLVNSVIMTKYQGQIALTEGQIWHLSHNASLTSDNITNTNNQRALYSLAMINTNFINDSPVYGNIPIVYNTPTAFEYYHITQESEFDELEYLFSAPLDLSSNVLTQTYTLYPNAQWPISSLSVDQTTGLVQMTPSTFIFSPLGYQCSIFAVIVNEYRTIGNTRVLIGSTLRNMNVQIGTQGLKSEPAAEFTMTPAACTPVIQFNDVSQGTVTNWEWDFGCGHHLSSNGNLGNTPVNETDNSPCIGNYVHTTGTYQNPIHDYSHVRDASCNQSYPSLIVTLVTTNTCGNLSAETIFDLKYNDHPGKVTITGGDGVYCIGDQITLHAVSNSEPNYDQYNWNIGSLGEIVSGQGTSTLIVNVTSPNGGQIEVRPANNCGPKVKYVVQSEDCCPNSGLFGIATYDGLNYNHTRINETNYGGVYLNGSCGVAASQVTNSPAQGSSSIDQAGNYYYTEGNKLRILRDQTCVVNEYNFLQTVSEPEYDATSNSIWMILGNNLVKYSVPYGLTPGIISKNYPLGGHTPIIGSSTLDAKKGIYYFVSSQLSLGSTNGPVQLGVLVSVDLASGIVSTKTITENPGKRAPAGTITNQNTRVVELEVLKNGQLAATVYHLVSEMREDGGALEQDPNGGGRPDDNIHIPVLDIVRPDIINQGQNNMVEVFYYQWDVMTINPANGNASLFGQSPVSYDNISSSTYDEVENTYYLTAGNGTVLYTVDLDNGGVIGSQNSLGTGKYGPAYHEIEFLNCGVTNYGMAVQNDNPLAEEKTQLPQTTIEPNPTTDGTFQLNWNETMTSQEAQTSVNYVLTDALGRIMEQQLNATLPVQFNLSRYPTGVYYFSIEQMQQREVKKILFH